MILAIFWFYAQNHKLNKCLGLYFQNIVKLAHRTIILFLIWKFFWCHSFASYCFAFLNAIYMWHSLYKKVLKFIWVSDWICNLETTVQYVSSKPGLLVSNSLGVWVRFKAGQMIHFIINIFLKYSLFSQWYLQIVIVILKLRSWHHYTINYTILARCKIKQSSLRHLTLTGVSVYLQVPIFTKLSLFNFWAYIILWATIVTNHLNPKSASQAGFKLP